MLKPLKCLFSKLILNLHTNHSDMTFIMKHTYHDTNWVHATDILSEMYCLIYLYILYNKTCCWSDFVTPRLICCMTFVWINIYMSYQCMWITLTDMPEWKQQWNCWKHLYQILIRIWLCAFCLKMVIAPTDRKPCILGPLHCQGFLIHVLEKLYGDNHWK